MPKSRILLFLTAFQRLDAGFAGDLRVFVEGAGGGAQAHQPHQR